MEVWVSGYESDLLIWRQIQTILLTFFILAAASATAVGHFPWFFTFNTLQEYIPKTEDPFQKLGRNAFIGFVSSLVSDTTSNSLRVIKTTRQTYPSTISYMETLRLVVDKDGIMGLLGRGLKTR